MERGVWFCAIDVTRFVLPGCPGSCRWANPVKELEIIGVLVYGARVNVLWVAY
jgi:hypothetical protein